MFLLALVLGTLIALSISLLLGKLSNAWWIRQVMNEPDSGKDYNLSPITVREQFEEWGVAILITTLGISLVTVPVMIHFFS